MTFISRLCIAIAALMLAWPAFAAQPEPLCKEGTPQSVDARYASIIRPTQTAICPYGFDEFSARMMELLTDKRTPYTVETVEKDFGLPEMTTIQDETREASYNMVVSGDGGWRVVVSVSESFYPINKGPAEFLPGLHPKRLNKVKNADLSIYLHVLGASPTLASVQCVAVWPVIEKARAAGWEPARLPPSPLSSLSFYLGNRMLAIGSAMAGARASCNQQVFFEQGPNVANRL